MPPFMSSHSFELGFGSVWPAPPTPQGITDLTLTFSEAIVTSSASFLTFSNGNLSPPWDVAVSNHNRTITFTAEPGVSLNSGGVIVSSLIIFNGAVHNVHFTGAWSAPVSAVPEPNTTLLLGSGLLLFGIMFAASGCTDKRELST